ncbi:ribonuclease HII [Pyrococcus yayanosii]|uniref:Ribonuclease HII n=1 Tax=Pyrococcus yayanosii (strain CH1 / JCM 16557) TaxID=529709 RepID=F8AIQ2_PYRYC|nr:ribonuclease HII [Pyrococcus yayanosii]AEH23941.1 ribonuclease HII [Pyrococcus yayanosii CH1]
MKVAGIDEAGRGPVLGPLVIVAVVVDEKKMTELEGIGVRDSKALTPKKREKLFERILSMVDDYSIVLVEPPEIDARAGTMNELEVEKFAQALNSLKVKPDVVYVDSADVRSERFGLALREKLAFDAKVVSEHKADAKYPVVSAASILAKVIRDREIEKLKLEYGDFGSGYPSDPRTRAFLEDYYRRHGDFPPMVRRTWKTVKEIEKQLGRKGQLTLDQFLP